MIKLGDGTAKNYLNIIMTSKSMVTSIGLDPNSRHHRVNLLTTIKGVLKKYKKAKSALMMDAD